MFSVTASLEMFYRGQIIVTTGWPCCSLERPALIHFIFLYRGGRGGGYKELDEQELEETKRRRREAEQVKYSLAEAFSVFVFSLLQFS